FYFQLGRYQEAVAAYQQAIRCDPDFMLSYDLLNTIYNTRLGDFDATIELTQKQIARNPTHVVPFGQMGLAYVGKNNLNAAVDAFKKVISMEPNYTPVRYWLGNVYRLQGDYQQAIEILVSIPKINAADYAAYYDAGVVYRLSGDDERARQSFQTVRQELEKQ